MIERRPLASLDASGRGWPGAAHRPSRAKGPHPAPASWGALRAWRDATIAPGAGLPAVLHADVEIITCVREGVLTHEDDLGNGGRTRAGDVQVMSAGTGLTYAEFNMESEPARVYQIWIEPDRRGAPPSWGRKSFARATGRGRFVTLASGIGADEDALPIRSDARVLALALKAGETATYRFAQGSRRGFLAASQGRLRVNDLQIDLGDGAAILGETHVCVTALDDVEIVLVDTRA